jgi:hypothetical protein
MVFDISEPGLPVALNGVRSDGEAAHFSAGAKEATFVALNPQNMIKPDLETTPRWRKSLLDPGWGADYIAIVADVQGFEDAIDPLLLHRRDQGLRVARVSVEQIFDEFGHGHRDPQAIKEFITYAAENWGPPAPRYILLVGDATYDVTNMTRGKNRNRLPTRVAYTHFGGFVADDIWFGTDEENIAKLAIGRFPAQNAPQLRAMVKKTIEYEDAVLNAPGGWRDKALLIADDEVRYDEEIAGLADYLSGRLCHGIHRASGRRCVRLKREQEFLYQWRHAAYQVVSDLCPNRHGENRHGGPWRFCLAGGCFRIQVRPSGAQDGPAAFL